MLGSFSDSDFALIDRQSEHLAPHRMEQRIHEILGADLVYALCH